MEELPPKAVYIHIPFCSHKCHYCDFTAYVVDGQPVDDYLYALFKEIEMTLSESPPGPIHSIFIGGGTPTVLSPKQMKLLLEELRQFFNKRMNSFEFTIEANPGTTTDELLYIMREGGINRISFGAQTFRNDLLKRIGRIHGSDEIKESVYAARRAGFENISLDLMFGLPTQTVEDVYQSLEEALNLEPTHLSCYSLKVEEGTLFHHLFERDQLPLPSEDEEFEMYQCIRKMLQKNGYQQYEISNFSKPGYESIHNKTYWRNEEYYGFGAGAHGYVNRLRHMNIKGVREYIDYIKKGRRPILDTHDVKIEEDMENFMILGLRLIKGISKEDFEKRYHKKIEEVFGNVLESLKDKGLIEQKDGRIKLTQKGLLFGNDVFASFINIM